MWRESLSACRINEVGSIEGRYFDLTFGATDAAFVAAEFRVPANVDDAADIPPAYSIITRGVVFDRVMMNCVRELSARSLRLAEKKIQDVDAVGGDVEERSTSRLDGVDEPAAAALAIKPAVTGEFGDDRTPDGSGFQQLLRALHFRIAAAIVSDTERLAAVFYGLRLGRLQHGAGLRLVHRHGLLAEHMLAGAQGLNGLRRMKEHRRTDVDGIHYRIGECLIESRENPGIVRGGFRRIAGDEAIKRAAWLGLNRGNDAASRNVADSDDDPVVMSRFQGFKVSKYESVF